jgi:hypothetical protein
MPTGSGSGAPRATPVASQGDPLTPLPTSDDPDSADPAKAIAELGAIPAWQAVVDRYQLLGRRNQHGVVYGKLGEPVMSRYTWLIDDTDGNGCLSIKVDLGKDASAVKLGDRVAFGGAWLLDTDRIWYWKVDAISPLAPSPSSDLKDPPAAPGHAIANGELPYGARKISVARDDDAVIFQLVGGQPAGEGDGWPVADELGNQVFATLVLPGERSSYGGQDMRTPEERWSLKRGQTYWVRIGKLHKRGPDKPVLLYARTAPVRVK